MFILEEKLTPLIRAIEGSLESKNLYAALSLSLTLPDICSSIIHRGKTNGKYYAQFNL